MSIRPGPHDATAGALRNLPASGSQPSWEGNTVGPTLCARCLRQAPVQIGVHKTMLFPLAAHDTETIAILDRPGRRIEIGMASSEKVAHLVLKQSWIKALRTDVYIVRVRRRDCRTEGVKLVDHQSKVVER
jgi:hypothetical protein